MTDKRTRADLLNQIHQLQTRIAQLEAEYQHAMQAKSKSEDEIHLSQLLETLPITIFIYQNQQMVYLNPAGHYLGGYNLEAILGDNFWQIVHPDSVDTLRDVFRQFNASGELNARIEVKAYNVHHQLRVLDVQMVSITYNHQPALLGAVLDMTERLHAHERQLALETEKQRVKLLTDFVRDVSHDFRTPLSTINTCVYLLGRIDDPIKRQQKLDIMREQVRHLDKLVDGLLTMSRLDSTQILPFKLFDLNLVIIETLQSLAPYIKEKKHQIHTDLQDDLSLIMGDMQDVYRAVREIVSNAVQYTPSSGEITIQTRQHNTMVMIMVQDNGDGISEADLPRIFDRFFRADQARTTGGVGLGLSIARKVIEYHHGYIDVQSKIYHGSIFRIYLPIRQLSEDT